MTQETAGIALGNLELNPEKFTLPKLKSITDVPAIVAVDLNRRITVFNHTAEQLTGYSLAEVVGNAVDSFIDCREEYHARGKQCPLCMSHDALKAAFDQRAFDELTYHGDIVVRSRRGNLFSLRCDITPMVDTQAETRGLLLLMRPVTNIEDLPLLSSDLLALLIHQLRTHLTYIRLAAEGLEGGFADFASQQQGMHFIQDKVTHATGILERGLTLVRVLQHNSLQAELIDLPSLVATVIRQAGRWNEQREISISMNGNTTVFGNRLLISLIVESLLQNALIHAGADSSIRITAEEQGRMVVVCIEDNGRGIPSDQLAILFQPTLPSTSDLARATRGMGLYLTRIAVEIQGGQIWAESQQSVGSRFYFCLPKYGIFEQIWRH